MLSQVCTCWQAWSRAAVALSGMGLHQEAATQLCSFKTLQQTWQVDACLVDATSSSIKEKLDLAQQHCVNHYTTLGLQQGCSNEMVGACRLLPDMPAPRDLTVICFGEHVHYTFVLPRPFCVFQTNPTMKE